MKLRFKFRFNSVDSCPAVSCGNEQIVSNTPVILVRNNWWLKQRPFTYRAVREQIRGTVGTAAVVTHRASLRYTTPAPQLSVEQLLTPPGLLGH